jgi:hypothetical protein
MAARILPHGIKLFVTCQTLASGLTPDTRKLRIRPE